MESYFCKRHSFSVFPLLHPCWQQDRMCEDIMVSDCSSHAESFNAKKKWTNTKMDQHEHCTVHVTNTDMYFVLFSCLPSRSRGEPRSYFYSACFSFNCHSCVDQLIHLKTFLNYLSARPHQHFLLCIDSVRPVGVRDWVEMGGGERERK